MNRSERAQRHPRRTDAIWWTASPRTPTARVEVLQKLLGEPACRQLGIYPIPAGFKLSVVIPVYNEERWLAELVRRVQAVEIPKELILVNDCSTDGTPAILEQLEKQYDNVRVFHQPKNMGKGAALREGFKHCTGDLVIVQDADWEYDPAEYPKLIQPILDGRADVVVRLALHRRAATACSTSGTRSPTRCSRRSRTGSPT